MISVNYWCSLPHTNDDCDCGWDFETVEEALKFFYSDPTLRWNPKYIELIGEGYNQVRKNFNYTPPKHDDFYEIQANEWRQQQAMMGNY